MDLLKKHLDIFLRILAIIIFIMMIIMLYKITNSNISDNVAITLITSLGILLTIIGSITIVQMTSKSNLKEQRAMDIRKIKLKYYHKFMESYNNKLMYSSELTKNNLSIQKKLAKLDEAFNLEVNRLPLYASQEVVEFIENAKDTTDNKDTTFGKMYELIRKDISNDEFNEFEKLNISHSVPKFIVIKEENGNENLIKIRE